MADVLFQLRRLRLHGIGPYITPAVLEIRPTTILCGINGSGKSTWFNALRLLQRHRNDEHFPFGNYADEDGTGPDNVGIVNSLLYVSEAAQLVEDPLAGPPGSITIEFRARRSGFLKRTVPLERPEKTDIAFLLSGEVTEGAEFRIRACHPMNWHDAVAGLRHEVSLEMQGSVLAKFERRWRADDPTRLTPDHYEFTSPIHLPESLNSVDFRKIAMERLQECLTKLLDGYFALDAIRLPEQAITEEGAHSRGGYTSSGRHYVGENGQSTWAAYAAAKDQICPSIALPDGTVKDSTLSHFVSSSLGELLGIDLVDAADEGGLDLFMSDFFHQSQPPRQLSSGFHQIAPIVMQLGLMRPGECVSIQNPEVHLHPDLQLKLSEFLLRQARTNRIIIIETHSDLMIRRAMRAILEENHGLGQHAISLNFCDVSTVTANGGGGNCSRMQPFGINDNDGTIIWPKGFLDESLQESNRLMDLLYGVRKHEKQEDL